MPSTIVNLEPIPVHRQNAIAPSRAPSAWADEAEEDDEFITPRKCLKPISADQIRELDANNFVAVHNNFSALDPPDAPSADRPPCLSSAACPSSEVSAPVKRTAARSRKAKPASQP